MTIRIGMRMFPQSKIQPKIYSHVFKKKKNDKISTHLCFLLLFVFHLVNAHFLTWRSGLSSNILRQSPVQFDDAKPLRAWFLFYKTGVSYIDRSMIYSLVDVNHSVRFTFSFRSFRFILFIRVFKCVLEVEYDA